MIDPTPFAARLPHQTRPIQVWVDVDVDIADMVLYLNTIPGVRTQTSCQGTIGEGGPHPYPPQVMCTWTPEVLARLQSEFDVVPEGNGAWGYVHPKGSTSTMSIRPKHVDVDKPTGTTKLLLRRWWRNFVKRMTADEVKSELKNCD